MIEKLIETAVLLPDLESESKDAVLGEMLDAIVGTGLLAAKGRDSVLAQLQEREAQGSTGLGNGVAVPHAKEAQVTEMVMALGIAHDGIPFDAIDGRDVLIVFLILGPIGGPPEEHLSVLRWVSILARNADFRRFAQQHASSSAALSDLLREMTESP